MSNFVLEMPSSTSLQNHNSDVNKKNKILSISEAPRIIVGPESQKVSDGDLASFVCIVSGHPPPSVHWLRAGKRIGPNRPRSMIANFTNNVTYGSILRIEPSKVRKDDGIIECRAENGVGEGANATARMEIYPDSHSGTICNYYIFIVCVQL